MDVNDVKRAAWFPELRDLVDTGLDELGRRGQENRPQLELELEQLRQTYDGWLLTLGNRGLDPVVRADVEVKAAANKARQQEVVATLAEQEHLTDAAEMLLDTSAILGRLDRLHDVLATANATLGNLELSLHIDSVQCFDDGQVVMRTCKLGLLGPGGLSMLSNDVEPPAVGDGGEIDGHQVIPRRRSRLRTEGVGDDEDDLDAAAYLASDPFRFAGLGRQWFWVDHFQMPDKSPSWVAVHAEAVFNRRQETRLPYSKLAEEFGVTSPTIGAAIRAYEAAHPGEHDEVKLRRGGKRRPKFDLSVFAQEVRQLWNDGWTKEQLAKKYDCSLPTLDKAIEFAYAQEGASMPKRDDSRAEKITTARESFEAGQSLETIAVEMGVSSVTVRAYVKESFQAEGKKMPDRRRRLHS